MFLGFFRFLSVKNCSIYIVEFLLKQDDINANIQDGEGWTLLQTVIRRSEYLSSFLIEIFSCFPDKVDPNIRNEKQGNQAELHLAVERFYRNTLTEKASISMIRGLFNLYNIKIDIQNAKGATPLEIVRQNIGKHGSINDSYYINLDQFLEDKESSACKKVTMY